VGGAQDTNIKSQALINTKPNGTTKRLKRNISGFLDKWQASCICSVLIVKEFTTEIIAQKKTITKMNG